MLDTLPLVLAIGELVLLLVAFSTGISIAVLVSNSRNDFKGDCLLYAGVNYTSESSFVLVPGDVSKCSYCIGFQALVVIIAAVYALYRLVVLITTKYDVPFLRFLVVPVFALLTLMVLVQAFIVTVGLWEFCKGLRSQPIFANARCENFQIANWHVYDGSRFYDTLRGAEIASWVSFFSWFALLLLSMFSAYKYRRYTKMNSSLPRTENE